MTIALWIIAFLLLLIELDLSNISISSDKIADRLNNVEGLKRSSERIENRLYAIEREMDKEVENNA